MTNTSAKHLNIIFALVVLAFVAGIAVGSLAVEALWGFALTGDISKSEGL